MTARGRGKPKLSELTLCVCVRDGERYLETCVDSLLKVTQGTGARVIVVDHLSKDNTPALLKNLKGKFPKQLEVVRFEREGLAAVRNHAWRLATTPWIAFVDVDTEVHEEWAAAVESGIKHWEKDPKIAGFGGTNLVPENNLRLYESYALLLDSFVGGHSSVLNRRFFTRITVEHLPTLNIVLRKEALEAIDGFDESYVRVGEDLALSFRFREKGYQLWTNPGMTMDHFLRPTVMGWIVNMFLYGRGRCFFILRHPSSFSLKYALPPAIAVCYAGLAIAAMIRPSLAVWFALYLSAHIVGIAVSLLSACLRRKPSLSVWIRATLLIWGTHLAYGVGMWIQALQGRNHFRYPLFSRKPSASTAAVKPKSSRKRRAA